MPAFQVALSVGQPGSQHSTSTPVEIATSVELFNMRATHLNLHRDLNFRRRRDVTYDQLLVDVDVDVEDGSHDNLNFRRGTPWHSFIPVGLRSWCT